MQLSRSCSADTFTAASLAFLLLAIASTPVTAGAVDAASDESALSVSTDFPGGSAEVRSVDADAGIVHIHPALRAKQGWPCWWYLRVDGLNAGQELTLKVSRNPKPFRGGSVLAAAWAQPDRAVLSTDNATWTQTPPCRKTKDRAAVYRFTAPAETIWLAWGPPFLPSHADELLARIEASTPGAERFELARTRGDRPVWGIRLGGGTAKETAEYGVWVQARQHAWEAGSSWVARGFIEWVAGDDPAAVELRRKATVWFIPIMDVDNVAEGAGGKEAVPRDHNRDWSDEPVYPEVAAAQKQLRELDKAGRLDLFIDLHNPGASEKKPYFFGPFGLDQLAEQAQRNYARWLTVAGSFITDPLPLDPQYHFATYVKTDEEKSRMSTSWVQRRTAPHTVAVTLETVWNTPHSTQQGYRIVGRQLGLAVARYLALDPRRAVEKDK